jgi:hypothetical protein
VFSHRFLSAAFGGGWGDVAVALPRCMQDGTLTVEGGEMRWQPHAGGGAEAVRAALAGAVIRTPKTGRKVAHSFRLELASPDAQGRSKYILAAPSAAELAEWTRVLRGAAAAVPTPVPTPVPSQALPSAAASAGSDDMIATSGKVSTKIGATMGLVLAELELEECVSVRQLVLPRTDFQLCQRGMGGGASFRFRVEGGSGGGATAAATAAAAAGALKWVQALRDADHLGRR